MLILACETSGDLCSVALRDDAGVRAEFSFRHERRLTERLPQIVDFVLAEAGATLEQVDAFAAGTGPGSFTGVRVAATVVKAWAWALGKPAVGVPSLEAVAQTFDAPARVVPIAPCRRGEVIAWLGGDDYRQVATDALAAVARETLGPGDLTVTGESAAWVAAGDGVRIVPRAPRASQIARMAAERLAAGGTFDPMALVPLYVAPPPIRGRLAP